MITNEGSTASHDVISELKISFSKIGLEIERTGYLSKYVKEM
jgi:hypothetical protein